MIPQSFIDDLIQRADIVDVVGRYVQLKRAGANFLGLCPFHGEKTPSFTVSPGKQFYHCFGCGAHGHVIGFLMEYQGLGFVEAVKDLAQQMGLTVPETRNSPEERERAQVLKAQQASLSDVLGRAARHYRQELKRSERAIGYLKGRGLSGEICARFGIGYAPAGWRGLTAVFPDYDNPLLVESGLVIDKTGDSAGEGGTEHKRYDRFRDRIMFPIRSVQGEVIGFGARVIDGGEPKYLNSPETAVFVKGRELYGLYEARTALRERGYALVCEGYMDVVALAQSGFANAVATLGTACTGEHVQKLLRFTERVVFSFDGDAAGRRAASRAMVACLPHADATRHFSFLFLPPEHDPDSFVRAHGAEGFERAVNAAVPLSRQLLDEAARDCDLGTAEGRARLLAQAREWVEQLPAGPLREQIIIELAGQARMDAAELSRRLGSAPAQAPTPTDPGRPAEAGWRRKRAAPWRTQPPRPAATPLLERAAWILLQRADLWEHLSAEIHDLLARQAAPYGLFFCALDRLLHDEGPMAPGALRQAIVQQAETAEQTGAPAQSDGGVRALCERLEALHDIALGEHAQQEFHILLQELRLDEVNEQLEVLLATDGLSEEAATQRRHLLAERAALKSSLPELRRAAAQAVKD